MDDRRPGSGRTDGAVRFGAGRHLVRAHAAHGRERRSRQGGGRTAGRSGRVGASGARAGSRAAIDADVCAGRTGVGRARPDEDRIHPPGRGRRRPAARCRAASPAGSCPPGDGPVQAAPESSHVSEQRGGRAAHSPCAGSRRSAARCLRGCRIGCRQQPSRRHRTRDHHGRLRKKCAEALAHHRRTRAR